MYITKTLLMNLDMAYIISEHNKALDFLKTFSGTDDESFRTKIHFLYCDCYLGL